VTASAVADGERRDWTVHERTRRWVFRGGFRTIERDRTQASATHTRGAMTGAEIDVDETLDRAGFAADENVLTRRQAEVLALRERDVSQADIADRLGTSRANVSSIEASARENISKARETVAFAEALRAPVRVVLDAGTDLYDVPARVFDECDEVGVKVNYTAPELMKLVSDAAGDAVSGRNIEQELLVGITSDGEVRVRRQTRAE
jgi:Tfx family DNA-binding protein